MFFQILHGRVIEVERSVRVMWTQFSLHTNRWEQLVKTSWKNTVATHYSHIFLTAIRVWLVRLVWLFWVWLLWVGTVFDLIKSIHGGRSAIIQRSFYQIDLELKLIYLHTTFWKNTFCQFIFNLNYVGDYPVK